jgi:hypothetical protein
MDKTYTLNEYYSNVNSTATRAEIYPDKNTATNLLVHHRNMGAREIPLWDCIVADVLTLPMPSVIMEVLDKKINIASERVIITGIDAYLSLLSRQTINDFMNALHSRIDEGKQNAVYMVSKTRFDSTKFAPKFVDSLSVVYFVGNVQDFIQPTVTVVSGKWVNAGNNPTNWNALLKMLGPFEPSGDYTLILNNYNCVQAGLSDSVAQLLDITKIAKHYYDINVDLPRNVLEMLITKSNEENVHPLEYLKVQFGIDNIEERCAVRRLLELQNDDLWSAYIWLLQKVLKKDTYLSYVMTIDVSKDNLLHKYVSEAAISLLKNRNAINYSFERANAVKELGMPAEPLIIEFIASTKEATNDDVACWLNCGTEAERIEIIHRISKTDLTIGLPRLWHNLYPMLANYLSDEYDYGNSDTTSYFRDYRRLKIKNDITKAFIKQAFDTLLPPTIDKRDSVLQNFFSDNSVGLLVVDGMGAEYYPLVLAMAKQRGMNIEFAVVADVNLPSSTKFNPIIWDKNRRLATVHGVDNISHDGAIKHENCSPEHNIVATLSVFETVFNRIANGFAKYERIVLTADHGSSRLAVIAHEKGMDNTLPWNGESQDWRYSIAPLNCKCPSEFESCYNAENNITYWVVRGYNRLPKQGGKLIVHGGATLEERLVPIIVFSRTKSLTELKQLDKQSVPLLVEKDFFDI